MNRSESLLYFQLPTGMTALTVNMAYLGIDFFPYLIKLQEKL